MRLNITESLGIHGLSNYDAPILAALATNSTALLIGPHGSAKTMLVEKLTDILDEPFRHYNTSLLNYDDLVGYPIPDQNKKTLEFIQTPGTIWDAGFVLFDEISRARPEIQNKIFPIVYEHRVQGIKLKKLHHCWAAMNPPSDDSSFDNDLYSGSWALDLALADRFNFVFNIPGFNDLTAKDRKNILSLKSNDCAKVSLNQLIKEVKDNLSDLSRSKINWLAEYLNCLIPHLETSGIIISGRRARILLNNIISVYTAEKVLGSSNSIENASLRTLRVSLPFNACGIEVEQNKVLLAHKAAIEETKECKNSNEAFLRNVKDPIKKVQHALDMEIDKIKMSQLVSDAFASLSPPERYCWVYQTFTDISECTNVNASTLEMLAEVQANIMMGATEDQSEAIANNSDRWKVWQTISNAIGKLNSSNGEKAELIAIAKALFFYGDENVEMDDVKNAYLNIKSRLI